MVEYLGLILLCIVGFVLVIYIRTLRKIEKENIILQNNITQTQQFYDEMQERIDGIRRYRHDLQKHIRIVEQFLEEGKQFENYEEYQELQGYIREMQDDITRMHTNRYCEDKLINAICEIKAEECSDKRIPLEIQINISESSTDGIDPFHITGILMNLLDNAIEAELRMGDRPGRGILFNLEEESGGLAISVGNDVPHSFTADFVTTKQDKEEHGMGLLIARDYSSKYKGQLDFRYDEANHYLTIRTLLKVAK